MKKVNVSTKQMSKYEGKWVAIDTTRNRVVAVGNTLKDIDSVVTRKLSDKTPEEKIPAAFKVPYKDEGPYVL